MDHFREVKNNLTWHSEGKFEVELINGVIKKLNFCEPGKGPQDSGKCLTSTNYKFLQTVYSCLGDLFAFIEQENKRLGYKYALEVERPQHIQEGMVQNSFELIDNAYPMSSETKLRPLINYGHQQELDDSIAENQAVHLEQERRDIELIA